MALVNVIISIDDEHLAEITSVAEILQQAGFELDQILDLLGIISGTCEENRLNDLRQISGVAAVEIDQNYQLSPPDSAVQ